MTGISLFGMNQSTKFGKDYTLPLRKNKEKLQKIFLHNGYLRPVHQFLDIYLDGHDLAIFLIFHSFF